MRAAGRRGKEAGRGKGATRETDTQFRKAHAGVCEPMGGWWPWSEVSSFPIRAVLAGDSVGLQAAPALLAPALLPPPTLPWVMGPLSPMMMPISAACPQGGHQPPPGSQPLLLVASEAVVDLQRKRRKNTTGKTVVTCSSQSPQPPPNPAAPTCGGWRWVEMETRNEKMEETRSSKGLANLPPSTDTEPSSLLGPSHVPPQGRASPECPCLMGSTGCHRAVPGRDPALATHPMTLWLEIGRCC